MGFEPINWMDTLLNDADDQEISTLVHLVGKLDPYERALPDPLNYVHTQDEMRVITKFQEWISRHESQPEDDNT